MKRKPLRKKSPPAYSLDGIACRDETIKLLDARINKRNAGYTVCNRVSGGSNDPHHDLGETLSSQYLRLAASCFVRIAP